MSSRIVESRLPVGPPVPDWQPRPRPSRSPLQGRHCRVEPLSVARRARELHEANGEDREGRMWTYLLYGPHATLADYVAWLEPREASADPLFFTIVDEATDRGVGLASYLRIEPEHGTIEVGHLQYSPRLQRTAAATEAMYLMMKQAFDLGYRRYEWKCDALNTASRRAAERLGFRYEGTFRQAVVYKGRNRDTAWYSVIDAEWPALAAALGRWLDPANFDKQGRQRRSLATFVERQA
ncbi:MAG: N-acetyltransferase [Lysobacterales bacterium]|jgi:RimJ/RimL family protein N-acetyltransferase|nr:MAG: N-acetyltransferase [Xanthomonadales bacterium]